MHRDFDSRVHEECPACHGKGKGETYMGMMGDHDGHPWTCSSCAGRGFRERVVAKAPLADADLAKELRERSGLAYGFGDDARAIRLRNAADLIEGKVDGPYRLEPSVAAAR